MLEIGGDGLADFLDEGSDALVMGFARGDTPPALIPVDILYTEGRDFMRPDTEAGEEQQDGVIPQGCGTAVDTGGEDSLHLRVRQAVREWDMAPLPWERHGGFQTRGQFPTEHEEAQERAYGDTGHLASPTMFGGSLVPDKVRQGVGGHGVPLHAAGAK